MLKSAIVFPFASATIPVPGLTSVAPATRTNSAMIGPPRSLFLVIGKRLFDLFEQAVDRDPFLPHTTQFLHDLSGDVSECRRLWRGRVRDDDGMSAVPPVTNGGVDGNPSQERHSQFFCGTLPSSIR